MCSFFKVPKSGYYGFVSRLNRPEEDVELDKKIRRQQDKRFHTYGYRRMRQQLHKYESLLNRQFHAEKPNAKWVTNIFYIQTKQGVLYLSMIRDLYDNNIVAYKTETLQTVDLVLETIRVAMKREKKTAAGELHLHSD